MLPVRNQAGALLVSQPPTPGAEPLPVMSDNAPNPVKFKVVSLNWSRYSPPMSALGQQQTCAAQLPKSVWVRSGHARAAKAEVR